MKDSVRQSMINDFAQVVFQRRRKNIGWGSLNQSNMFSYFGHSWKCSDCSCSGSNNGHFFIQNHFIMFFWNPLLGMDNFSRKNFLSYAWRNTMYLIDFSGLMATINFKNRQVSLSSGIRGSFSTYCPRETFQNLPYFLNMKTDTVIFLFFILCNCFHYGKK